MSGEAAGRRAVNGLATRILVGVGVLLAGMLAAGGWTLTSDVRAELASLRATVEATLTQMDRRLTRLESLEDRRRAGGRR